MKHVAKVLRLPVKHRYSEATSANFQATCFFCDNEDMGDTLHKVMMVDFNDCAHNIAIQTQGTEILAKLSEGDMIAVYYSKCLAAHYNKNRTQKGITNEPDFIV